MIKRFSPAAASGARLGRIILALCLCLGLAACAESTTGTSSDKPTSQGKGAAPGTVKRVAYGISINVPDTWRVANAVEPGTVTNAEIESRVKSGNPTPLLVLVRPTNVPQQVDARVVLFLADSKKHLLPEEAAANLTQAQFDEQSQFLIKQRNEDAQKEKSPTRLLEWKITRDTVDGKLAILQKGLVQDKEGQSRMMIWYVYLPNGMGVVVEAAGKADAPGIEGALESIVKTLSVSVQ